MKTTQIITGTNHFTDVQAACRYYKPYGYDNRAVFQKLDSKEIEVGPPKLKAGETLSLNRQEGRYFITS